MASAVYLTFTIVVTKIECSLVAIVVFGTVNNRDLWSFAPNRHFNKATTERQTLSTSMSRWCGSIIFGIRYVTIRSKQHIFTYLNLYVSHLGRSKRNLSFFKNKKYM